VTIGSELAPAPATFAFPYHDVSGVPVLFARMAMAIASQGTAVDVIDYPEGCMANMVRGMAGITLRSFRPGVPVRVGPGTLLVMQTVLPATIAPEFVVDPATRLLFWTLHPMNWVQAIVPLDAVRNLQARYAGFHRLFGRTLLRPLTRQLRDLALAMHARGSLAFMDGETLDATCSRLEVTIDDPLMLPVCCDVPASNAGMSRVPHDPLAIGWLGRLSDFKIHILLRTLAAASAYAAMRRRRIVFHVIGEGPEAGRIRAEEFENPYFAIEQHGVITGAALEDFLLTRVDVLAAMGASALEGGRLGVPTILLDVAYGPVPASYRFRWLYDSERYTLGRFVDRRSLEPRNESLAHMIDQVVQDAAAISMRTYDYCRRHHSIEVITAQFLRAAEAATFRWGDMNPAVRKKGLVRVAYEAVRGWRHPDAAVQP
jgi:hypothetical protein